MQNIICVNGWIKDNKCCTGTVDKFIHGIRIIDGEKILHEFSFPFKVYISAQAIHFNVNGIETVIEIAHLEETKGQIKNIIKSCANGTYGSTMLRKTITVVVDTDPVDTISLPLLTGESHTGIYNVFVSTNKLVEGELPEDYTVLPNGDIQINTTLPVEFEPYIVVIEYWVTV